jgi:hypothetical protein
MPYQGGLGATQSASDAIRETQVGQSLNELGIAVADLNKIVEELDARLAAVVRQEGETIAKNTSTPRMMRVPVALGIDDRAEGVRTAFTRIRNILDRLEL